jgi:hypothetical protein
MQNNRQNQVLYSSDFMFFDPPFFDIMVGLAWSKDPGKYAAGSIATGRAFHTRQVKGDDPVEMDTLVLQVGGWT